MSGWGGEGALGAVPDLWGVSRLFFPLSLVLSLV
jgi:hypothetical protein